MMVSLCNMKKCLKCLLPETYETIEFDENGICNICNSIDLKKIDWERDIRSRGNYK